MFTQGGSLKLKSNDPFDVPAIDLNLLSHPFDLEAIKASVRIMKRWNSGPAWDGYIRGFAGPDPDLLSDEEFEKTVRETAITFLHPVGTVRMSAKNSKEGVVDGELRLKGADGIRVVDASVFVSSRVLGFDPPSDESTLSLIFPRQIPKHQCISLPNERRTSFGRRGEKLTNIRILGT
jgi:choline dehydrogenase-like flavoprotein